MGGQVNKLNFKLIGNDNGLNILPNIFIFY